MTKHIEDSHIESDKEEVMKWLANTLIWKFK